MIRFAFLLVLISSMVFLAANDAGVRIDPEGLTVASDAGCGMDPNGAPCRSNGF